MKLCVVVQSRRLPLGLFIFGVVLALLGIPLLMFVRRREFYRRNQAGIEKFSSYGTMVSTRFLESSVLVLAVTCFFFGLLFVVLGGIKWALTSMPAWMR